MIVLDTHTWIWHAAEPRKLSRRARAALERAGDLGVCAISCWEVAMLVARRRLVLDRDTRVWLSQALALPKVTLLPLTPDVAVRAAGFGEAFPGDPADRMIVATAVELRAELVTKDERLRSLDGVRTLW